MVEIQLTRSEQELLHKDNIKRVMNTPESPRTIYEEIESPDKRLPG